MTSYYSKLHQTTFFYCKLFGFILEVLNLSDFQGFHESCLSDNNVFKGMNIKYENQTTCLKCVIRFSKICMVFCLNQEVFCPYFAEIRDFDFPIYKYVHVLSEW